MHNYYCYSFFHYHFCLLLLLLLLLSILLLFIIILIANTPRFDSKKIRGWGIICLINDTQLSVRKDNSWPIQIERLAKKVAPFLRLINTWMINRYAPD